MLKRKLAVLLLLFGLGASALVAQTIFVREFLVVFLGNELCLGMVFASWLLGIGSGAALGGRLARRAVRATLLAGCVLMMWALFPAQVYLIRSARLLLDVGQGELVPFLSLVIASLTLIGPFSFLVGLAFPLACAQLGEPAKEGAAGIGAIYVAEAVGSLAGGVLFTFVLVGRLSAFRIFALISMISVGAAMMMVRSGRRHRWLLALLATSAAGSILLLTTPLGKMLETSSIFSRWSSLQPGIPLLRTAEGKYESVDSKYQNLALGKHLDQYNLFANGKPTASFPDEPGFQEQAHFIMVQHPNPRRVLLIGGGGEGLIRQILKHGPERVAYVTLDPVELKLARKYLPEADRKTLDDPRVTIHYEDGRYFVKRTTSLYEMVILNLPDPDTALLNRFYTVEFFREVKRLLQPEGILVLGVSSVLGPLGKDLGPFAGSIYWSLREVFEDVFATPGTHIYFLASPTRGAIERDPARLAERFLSRNIAPAEYQHIYRYVLQPDLVERLAENLQSASTAGLNTDLRPMTYFYSLVLWDRYSGSRFAGFFHSLKELSFAWLVLPIVGALLLVVMVQLFTPGRRAAYVRLNVCLSIASTGFAAMAAELALLFAFQNIYGYVYQKVGLIVATFMLGLAAGGWFTTRWSSREEKLRMWGLIAIDLAIALFILALPLGVEVCAAGKLPLPLLESAFMCLVLVAGILTGLAFPLAAKLHLGESQDVGRTAGAIDACDHIGACLGAAMTGVVLVPMLGIAGACALVAALKACSIVLLLLSAITKKSTLPVSIGQR